MAQSFSYVVRASALAALGLLVLTGCAGSRRAPVQNLAQAENSWFRDGNQHLLRVAQQPSIDGRARNVIVFVGDGLDVTTVTAARIREGQLQGNPGEEHFLAFERLPHRALLKTYNTNQQVADSAGAGTALLSGVKTKAGVVGLDSRVIRGNCASARGREVTSVVELAQRAGMATGVVTNTRITHATPAATYGHVPERNWEVDAEIPEPALAEGCVDLARQLVEGPVGSSFEVIFGGGRGAFLPRRADRGAPAGLRADGRDLIAQWQHAHPGGRYVWNRKQLLDLEPQTTNAVLGLFAEDHMAFEEDRSNTDEPSLSEMTAKAIELLATDENGYLLVVEGGRIDHAHHYDNAYRALGETVELAAAVGEALERTDPEDTLIVVTSDHAHTMTMAGYPTRGNPILGKVVGNDGSGGAQKKAKLALDGMPYTTLHYANGLSAPRSRRRSNLSHRDTEAAGFQQPAAVPLPMETHGGEDVPSYARGPMAHLLSGTAEQNYVFHVIVHAADLGRVR